MNTIKLNEGIEGAEVRDADVTVCDTYIKAGKLLGVPLLDFLVIGTQGYTSFADKGIGGF